tara:strand:- start:7098 stop:7616 length:519 start_codon:yes stop_codon:yes gene_type:complete
MKMRQLNKIRICLCLNIFLLFFISLCIIIFASDSRYFRYGPNEDFLLISVKINTNLRYSFLLFLITCNNCIKVLISEIGEPILVFNVYNPDKKIITEFTKCQLLFYANSMFFIGNTRRVFELMITITQIDIALFSIIVEQMVSICTVYFLVTEKKFSKDGIELTLTSESEIN